MEQKRPWRKLVKKLQRKRRRQNLAKERDKALEKDESEKLKDPFYKYWLQHQEEVKQSLLIAEENYRQEQEELWLRRELISQKQFQKDEEKRKIAEAAQEHERWLQETEWKKQEELRQKKIKDLKIQTEKANKEFEDTMDSMQKYLDNVNMKTPRNLEKYLESRPGEKLCEFYEKTNCCRFGPGCTFNHKRPLLAKIIVIRNFFQHPLLEQQEHKEYDKADSNLEFNERDLKESYKEFCEDVWPELESFGKIVNFRTVRNIQTHLRGHVFVEFLEKRSALKAFINLQSRFYASKRLNVEFSNFVHWRTGVCGMRSQFLKGQSLNHKCPKGFKCNYLHLMRNPGNKYNMPMTKTPQSSGHSSHSRLETPLLSWNDLDTANSRRTESRNWRWSESPEVELKSLKTSNPRSKFSSPEKTPNSKHHKSQRTKSPNYRKNHVHKSPSSRVDNNSSHHNKNRVSKSPNSKGYHSCDEAYKGNRNESSRQSYRDNGNSHRY